MSASEIRALIGHDAQPGQSDNRWRTLGLIHGLSLLSDHGDHRTAPSVPERGIAQVGIFVNFSLRLYQA